MWALIAFVVGFFALMFALQAGFRLAARAREGRPVPPLPGPLGARLARGRSLLYFFSPSCGACRTITPQVQKLERRNPAVIAVNVAEQYDLARALRVMATPSFIEVADGTITGFHIGPAPEVLRRWSA